MVYTTTEGRRYKIGPATALFADPTELRSLNEANGVAHKRLFPYSSPPDALFVAGESVAGVESKFLPDLVRSVRSRRLARELRSLLRECQRAILLVRGYGSEDDLWNASEGVPDQNRADEETREALIELQAWGVIVLRVAEMDDWQALGALQLVRRVLKREAPRALAGTDRRPYRGREAGWFLRNIKGVGPVAAGKLHEAFGSTGAALAAPPEAWRELGIGAGVMKRREEALA